MDEQTDKQTDKQDQRESAMEVGTRKIYREGLESMDAATRSRLTQARHRALTELPNRRSVAFRWLPVGAAAAAVAMAWLLVSPTPTKVEPSAALLAEMEILNSEDELDMLEELEFYAWIDELDELEDGILGDGVG